MDAAQRSLSPKSSRNPSKLSQTFSRFKGIIRIPVSHKPGNDGLPSRDDSKGPYSRRSIAMKAYMSQPLLGQLRDTSTPEQQQSTGYSDPESCLSASPTDRDSDSQFEFPLPRSSLHLEDPPVDQRRRSRTQSLQSMQRKGSGDQTEKKPGIRRPGLVPQKQSTLPPTPPTPPPKSPSLFKLRGRSSSNVLDPESAPPTTSSASQSNGFKTFTRGLVRRTSKSRIKSRPEDEPPVPPLPSPFRTKTPSEQPPLAPSASASSTATATPSTVHGKAKQSSTSDADHAPTLSVPMLKKSVSSFKSSSGSSSFRTAASSFTNKAAEPATSESANVPAALFPIERRTASENADIRASVGNGEEEPKPQRLPLPARGFSMMSADGMGRLSPSIVLRPPPLPLLNLPRFPALTPSSVSGSAQSPNGRTRRNAGLSTMPALPLQGTGRGVGGHEEQEQDDDDDDDDDDLEDEYGGDDDVEDATRTSTSTSDTIRTQSSYEQDSISSSGSGSTFSGLQSGFSSMGRRPQLPPLNVETPFSVRFPNRFGPTVENPTLSPSAIAKGKNKEVSPPTPHEISSVGSDQDYGQFASSTQGMEHHRARGSHYFDSTQGSVDSARISSLLASSTSSTQQGYSQRLAQSPRLPPTPTATTSTTRSGVDSIPTSPLHTPRPEEYRLSHQRLVAPPLAERLSSLGSDRSSRLSVMGAGLSAQRPSMYKHASQSLIDIHSIEKREAVDRMVREGEEEQEKELRRKSIRRNRESMAMNFASPVPPSPNLYRTQTQRRPRDSVIEEANPVGPDMESVLRHGGGLVGITRHSSATRPVLGTDGPKMVGGDHEEVSSTLDRGVEVPLGGPVDANATITTQQQNRMSLAPVYDATPHPLRKRRSMPMFSEATAPPPYPTFAPHPSARFANVKIMPREDEGKEELPPYSNAIYLKAVLPRKMEFSAPGVQASDRKWKRVVCVLEGTMLKIFKCPLGTGGVSVIEQWWENKVGAGDVAVQALDGPGATSAAAPVAVRGVDANVEDEKLKHQYPGVVGATPTSAPVEYQMTPPTPASTVRVKDTTVQAALSRSALNIAVGLLKPGRHMRSHSDVMPPSPTAISRPPATRSSLNLSRSATPTPSSSSTTTVGSARSRSHSPMPPPSSAATSPYGSSSSNLMAPSSRPITPATASSTQSRFRSGTLPRTPRSASSSFSGKQGEIPDPNPEDLIKVYSLQNAESGLGNDYVKRKNVIRVRIDGEQFLLQVKDVLSVVGWIEGLQAATNIALDLDTRPMPRGPIFPRRRRRRRPQVAPIATSGIQPQGPVVTNQNVTVMETYTPTSATAGQPALRRTQ